MVTGCWSSNVNSNGFFFWVGWQQFFHNLELLVEDDSDDDQFTAKELPFLEICNFGWNGGPHYVFRFYLLIFSLSLEMNEKSPEKNTIFSALDKDDILHQKDHFQRSILKWNDGALLPQQHFKKFIINRRTRGRSVVENTNEFWNSNVAKRWKHQLFSTPPRLPLAIIPLEEEEEREER